MKNVTKMSEYIVNKWDTTGESSPNAQTIVEYQDEPDVVHVQTNINNMIATYGEDETLHMIQQVFLFKQQKKVG